MADAAAPREKANAKEKARARLLLDAAAQNHAAEPRGGACAATEKTTMSEFNARLRDRKTTLIDQIALLEAVRSPRRRWAQNGEDDDDEDDDDLRLPRDPRQTRGVPARKTRGYLVWIALALLLLVAVLTLRRTPQLCFQGYCLKYQPAPITAFRGGARHDLAVLVRSRDAESTTGAAEWVWSLGADGKLSRRQMGAGDWHTYEATRFLGAPVVQRRGATVRLFAVEAGTGHLMVSAYFRGEDDGPRRSAPEEARRRAAAWDRAWAARPGAWGWHSLGGRFVHPPAVVETAVGHVEAYAVTAEGALHQRVLSPGGWGAWAVVGGRGFAGAVDVAFASSGLDGQRGGGVGVAAFKDGQYQFAESAASPRPWHGVWRPLGRPDRCRGGSNNPPELGGPVLVALRWGEFAYVVACGGGVWQRRYGWDGAWSGGWEALGTGGPDVRLDPHSLVRSGGSDAYGDGPTGLYARASASGCVYHATHVYRPRGTSRWWQPRGSRWSPWRPVWCPDAAQTAAGNVTLAVDPVGSRAVVLGEPGGTFLYSGVVDFHSSDPLQWRRHHRP